MDINVSYDSSAGNAPSWFKDAVNYAVGQMDALITTGITLNLTFSWGEENNYSIAQGAAAQNQSMGAYVDYGTLYGALASHATTAADQTAVSNLTSTNPTGSGKFYVPDAMLKSLGLVDANASGTDGYVGLDSSLPWDTRANGQVSAGHYDPVRSLEHEITEVMGRVGYLSEGQNQGIYGPMDLFRYSAPGQRDVTPGPGYFSIDGQNMGPQFNNPLNGGDAADWANNTSDTFGDTEAGVAGNMSAADLQLLDVLGYSIGSAPTAANVVNTPPASVVSTPPALSFSTDVAFSGPRFATFSGAVSDSSAQVEVFQGATDLGTASVNGDGSWSLGAGLQANSQDQIYAVATNAAGQSTTTSPNFSLETGVRGARYVTTEQVYDDSGNVTANVFVRRNGATRVVQVSSRQRFAAAATHQSIASDPVAAGSASGRTLTATHGATMTGGGSSERFVFHAHPGQSTIADFVAGGSSHDTLSLPSSSFSSVADVLHHTRQVGNDAVVTLDAHDTITLHNTSVAALHHNRADFTFHG